MRVDRLYTHANVVTMDARRPRADALAIQGDRIVAVGAAHELDGLTAPHVQRIKNLGVIPVPQGRFVNELGDGMAAALGPARLAWCYRQRSFRDLGIEVPGSSDRPVVNGAPLRGIADLVMRRTSSGCSFNEAECVSAEEALRAWTVGSAYASFEDHRKGSLREGMLADMAVLSQDILTVPAEAIAETAVLETILGGVTTHRA